MGDYATMSDCGVIIPAERWSAISKIHSGQAEERGLSAVLRNLPAPATQRIALRVTVKAERALRNGHPWLFEQAITSQSQAGKCGDLAVIFDRKSRFLAIGLYDPHSAIRVRVLQHTTPATIDAVWLRGKIQAAIQLRKELETQPADLKTTGYRLVHGENDGLPGLVLDRYDTTVVIKIYSAAWIPYLSMICAGLKTSWSLQRIILRMGTQLQKQVGTLHGLYDGVFLHGDRPQGALSFHENGLCFEVDPVHGQKTGFFLDQRDNRARVQQLSTGKAVLNMFAYTGGFSVYAARGGARRVVSVDVSAAALQAAERNMALNQHLPAVRKTGHELITADAFQVLQDLQVAGRSFDVVILDPPAFARKRAQLDQALNAYKRLTRLGLGVLKPGGMLVQASCSSRVSAEAFFKAINQTAQAMGLQLRELEKSGHALDHPVSFAEGAYLKCLFAKVSEKKSVSRKKRHR